MSTDAELAPFRARVIAAARALYRNAAAPGRDYRGRDGDVIVAEQWWEPFVETIEALDYAEERAARAEERAARTDDLSTALREVARIALSREARETLAALNLDEGTES
jgi:hypothetical protein